MLITGAEQAPFGTDPLEHGGDWLPPSQPAPGSYKPAARQPFPTNNPFAVPVFERASSDWAPFNYNAGKLGTVPVQIARSNKGRKAVTISVLSAETNGVVIGPDPGPLSEYQNGGVAGVGVYELDPGDSVTIETEASVWACCQTGQTSGGCQGWETYNPAVLDPGQEY